MVGGLVSMVCQGIDACSRTFFEDLTVIKEEGLEGEKDRIGESQTILGTN